MRHDTKSPCNAIRFRVPLSGGRESFYELTVPACPEWLGEERRDAYIEHITAWERQLEDAIATHLEIAAQIVAQRWNEGYVYDYLAGMVEHRFYVEPTRSETSSSVYSKQRIPAKLRTAIFERDAYRCCHCGGWRDLSIDHIVPESKGGTLDPSNLQTLCRSCNSRKGNRA